jgi:RNA polymerase sigma factor (sigma-70 family)
MTIEELRCRHRELLNQKKSQEELLSAGKGDRMELALIQEELMDVNAKLRALSPGRRRVGGRSSAGNTQWAQDRQQYINWDLEDRESSAEIDDHQIMLEAVTTSLGILSSRQREVLDLYQSGIKMDEIGQRLGVNASTVSRTLGRAKQLLRQETERFLQQQWLSPKLDLSDPIIAKVVLSALTPVQSAYFYLYYSEWLSLREISQLTGTDPSSILRTLQRALRNIGSVFGYRETVLENIDALDELAYRIYCEVQNTDVIVPMDRRPQKYCKPCATASPMKSAVNASHLFALPPITICSSRGEVSCVQVRSDPHQHTAEHGRLLTALLERVRISHEKPHSVISWLISIFSKFSTGKKSGIRWWRKTFSVKNPSLQVWGEGSTIYAKEEDKIT